MRASGQHTTRTVDSIQLFCYNVVAWETHAGRLSRMDRGALYFQGGTLPLIARGCL